MQLKKKCNVTIISFYILITLLSYNKSINVKINKFSGFLEIVQKYEPVRYLAVSKKAALHIPAHATKEFAVKFLALYFSPSDSI